MLMHGRTLPLTPKCYKLSSYNKLDLNEIPFQKFRLIPYKFDQNLHAILDDQIEDLFVRGIIQEIELQQSTFISNVFFQQKQNGSYRMIIDLSKPNGSIKKKHFKMQHLDVATEILKPGCCMASIDLKNAYYSVPIHTAFRNCICFQWQNRIFQFKAMPFGLTSAPRLFIKLLKPVYSLLHEEGFLGLGFIDNSFLIANNQNECTRSVDFMLSLLQKFLYKL